MGNFLSFSGVIGKSRIEVLNSLVNYAKSVGGDVLQESILDSNDDNCCVIEEKNRNTTILYPNHYLEWDSSSEYISKELNATVFSFHIHDGDFWMYVLYNNGKTIDQFNPIPDYWDEDITIEEIESWKGNSKKVAEYLNYINTQDIEKYLVRWNLDDEENVKAYPEDEFAKEEWQLIDFMKKLKIPEPLDENGNPKGLTYKLYTNQLKLKSNQEISIPKAEINSAKPWWKFW